MVRDEIYFGGSPINPLYIRDKKDFHLGVLCVSYYITHQTLHSGCVGVIVCGRRPVSTIFIKISLEYLYLSFFIIPSHADQP